MKILKRFNDNPLPHTKIINLNINKINNKFISNSTTELVKEYLHKGDQVLFLLTEEVMLHI